MNINDIFENIDFKIKPNQDYRKEYIFRAKKLIYKIFNKEKNFIFSNLIIKNKKKSDLILKKELLKIDSMSTFAIGYVINKICQELNDNENYVNIGVWKGFSMIAGMLNTNCNVYGNDNFSQFDGPKKEFIRKFNSLKNEEKHFFYECDYKDFFKDFEKLKKSISFYYYDGEHTYKNQFENLIIAKEYFKSGTIILVDDINFQEVESGTKDFISKYPNEYKIIKDIKTANNHCHPSYWNGLFLFQKK
jgi:hypothetical protein|tara:strand:- start:1022 stop:1762 length:741 start_codon:yes stop_codon:yes gene_type:complete